MLDFNTAEIQSQSTGRGPIPPDSCVIVQMHLRSPKAGKQGSHELLGRSDKGNEYIDVEFKVVQGAYEGKQIWQNFTVKGSEQAVKISMRTLRAIVESARNISPSDQSPAAAEGRTLSDWSDFEGMQCIVKVDAKAEVSIKDGNTYVNNHIKKIITPDMEEYAVCGQAGEIISDKQLPTEAEAPKAKPAAAGPGSWAAPAAAPTAAAPAPTQAAAKPAGGPLPGWAKK